MDQCAVVSRLKSVITTILKGGLIYLSIILALSNCKRKNSWHFEVNDVTKVQIFRVDKGNRTEGVGIFEKYSAQLDGEVIIQQWQCKKSQVDEILTAKNFPSGTVYQPKILVFHSGKTEIKDSSEVYAEVILMRFVPVSAKKGSLVIDIKIKH